MFFCGDMSEKKQVTPAMNTSKKPMDDASAEGMNLLSLKVLPWFS